MNMSSTDSIFQAVVVGSSAGGLFALTTILEKLPEDYTLPIIIVQHRTKEQGQLLEEILQTKCKLKIKQADEKEKIKPGYVYVAPPNYHLLIEKDKTLSLSSDERIKFSRPSIDVLFETAAYVFQKHLIGIIMTGANSDGTEGMCAIQQLGGLTIAQQPSEAEYRMMPEAAIEAGCVGHVMSLIEIQSFLYNLSFPK